MKIYGDTISPFVRMTLVAAHECGLGNKVEQVKENVKPTEECKADGAFFTWQNSGSGNGSSPPDL